MLARVTVWIFYAAVFFMLGAWLGPSSGALEQRVKAIWSWGYHQVVGAPPTASQPTAQPTATLSEAREAYQRGDITMAIARYRTAIAAKPTDIDIKGELANVFYGAGRLEEAAGLYSDVANQLADRGEPEAARRLEPAIRRGSPALADALLRRLAS